MKTICIATIALALCACERALTIQGAMEDGSETITGSATSYVDGGVTITLTGNKGLSCTGLLVYRTKREGRGSLLCSNGQSAPFEFVSTGNVGTATGHIGTRSFTFTFG